MSPAVAAQVEALLAEYVTAKLPQVGDYSPIEAERRDMTVRRTSEKVCDLLLRAGTRELAEAVR